MKASGVAICVLILASKFDDGLVDSRDQGPARTPIIDGGRDPSRAGRGDLRVGEGSGPPEFVDGED
jgi:hypothetical protein